MDHCENVRRCRDLAGRVYVTCLVGLTFVASPGLTGGLELERHQEAGVIDLLPGSSRGTITQPLFAGTHAVTGEEILFVLTDASDKDFAERFGAIRADSLDEAPDSAVETALFEDGKWTFFEDPGLVARFDPVSGHALPPLSNPDYSPLKRVRWQGKVVTVNVPFVRWGDGNGQQLLIDYGGCDPLIRKNPPSPFFEPDGPTNGADCLDEEPLDRYKGGQAVAIDLEAMTVTMKLHKAVFNHPDKIPYYTVFEASKGPPAGFMGVIHAPKLANLGRHSDNDSVGRVAQFGNGVRTNAGGPNRFQPGLSSYRGGQSKTYSPMWHITWVFFDCDEDGVFFSAERNVGEGAKPSKGSKIPGFDPAERAEFDPFQMDDKGVSCPGVASAVTGNSEGFVEDFGHLEELEAEGLVVQTEAPGGLRLHSELQPPLIVNCPTPVTAR